MKQTILLSIVLLLSMTCSGTLLAQQEAATWLQPGDTAILAAARAGYEGKKLAQGPIGISVGAGLGKVFHDSVRQVKIATPVMIAWQLGQEQRKIFGPAPDDSKVLETSGTLGFLVQLQLPGRSALNVSGNAPEQTSDVELAIQIEDEMLRPTMKEVTSRDFHYNQGLSYTTVDIVSSFRVATLPKGHGKLLVRWNSGREDTIDVDFDKLTREIKD